MKNTINILLMILFTFNCFSQEWKKYPYQPENSLISFPKDEGYHSDEPTEWWYTFAHLKGQTTGNDYTIMLTFISRDTLFFNGLRIFNISNENTGEFYSDGKPFKYISNSVDYQDISALVLDHNESWSTLKDNDGNLVPFNYKLKAKSPNAIIDLNMNVIKRPLILNDSGFLYQGKVNYTYYYSFTEMEVFGELSFNGLKENVEGLGWFDKQYGNFHPEVGEKYEWLSIKLSNGMDINTWNIFTTDNKLPEDPKYKAFNCYINDSTYLSTSNFKINHLGYYYSPDSQRIYGEKFRLTEESTNMDIVVSVQNPNCEPTIPFPFYEGPTSVEGTVGGKLVTGKGFAELLHFYKNPTLEIITPSSNWDETIPIRWKVTNPDDGRPLVFDIISENINDNSFKYFAQNIKDTFYLINPEQINFDSLYSFKIIAKSIDSLLTGSIISSNAPDKLGIKDLSSNINLKVYPTLFKEELHIKSINKPILKNTQILLISLSGKIVYENIINKNLNKLTIDTKLIKAGVYFLYTINKNSISIQKIVSINK